MRGGPLAGTTRFGAGLPGEGWDYQVRGGEGWDYRDYQVKGGTTR